MSGPCTSTPSKRKKYVCKYEQFWEKRVYVVKKSDTGEDMAHCKLCNTNCSVAAGALYYVKRHDKRSTHVTAVEASSNTKSIMIRNHPVLYYPRHYSAILWLNTICLFHWQTTSQNYYQSYVSDCYDFKPSHDVLKSAKMSCVNYNLSLK